MPAPINTTGEIAGWLEAHHATPVTGLEPLSGGYWSKAYAYVVQGQELVLRLGERGEGFEADRNAMAFDSDALPVPEVLHVGEALGRACAISRRHHGRFLEDVRPEEAAVTGPMLGGLLAALRAVSPAAGPSWRRWLVDSLVENPQGRQAGWRAMVAAEPEYDRLFRAAEQRLHALLDACPERRDLVHGDLLHQNVLVSTDGARPTAVFSWKCSLRGDHLYDTAWCTFWAPWHPGIEAADAWGRTPDPGPDASLRHHAYELHIGAVHLGWCAWSGEGDLTVLAQRVAEVLQRGPLST